MNSAKTMVSNSFQKNLYRGAVFCDGRPLPERVYYYVGFTAFEHRFREDAVVSYKDDISTKIGLTKKSHGPFLWLGLAALVIGLGAAWYVWQNGQGDHAKTYVSENVQRSDIEVTVSAVGSIEPTDMFDISSELSGTIENVLVDFNDTVDVGTVLAKLDTSRLEAQLAVQQASLDSAIANVALAEASLEEARQAYQRGLELKARGVESDSAFDAQEAAYFRAQADLQSAHASRHLAEANLDLVNVDLDKSCICSPVKGIVLDRDIDPGQIVAASLSAPTLFTVAEDLTRMELQVDVDEADIGRVEVGQKANFTVDAYDERTFPAEILQVRFASETVDGVVTYKAILTVDNSDLSLRPGMTASADITVASVKDALVVPNAALRYTPSSDEAATSSGGGSGLVGMIMPKRPGDRADKGGQPSTTRTVWVLRDDTPQPVSVQVGESDGTRTEVTSDELTVNDKVVTDEIDAN